MSTKGLFWRPLPTGEAFDPRGKLAALLQKRGLPFRVTKEAAPYFQALVDSGGDTAAPAAEVLKQLEIHGTIELYMESP